MQRDSWHAVGIGLLIALLGLLAPLQITLIFMSGRIEYSTFWIFASWNPYSQESIFQVYPMTIIIPNLLFFSPFRFLLAMQIYRLYLAKASKTTTALLGLLSEMPVAFSAFISFMSGSTSGGILLFGMPVPIPLIASILIYKFMQPPKPEGLWEVE